MNQQHSEIALARPVIEVASHRRSFGTRLVETLGAVLGLGDDAVSVVAGQSANETVRSLARGSARSNSFVNLDQLEELCKEQPGEYLIEGLLPVDDVHIAVGDSGLGKTPWAYQLGLCVASGKPFLDRTVKQGRVLYFDLENGREAILGLARSICGHLGIPEFPPEFFILQDNGNAPSLAEAAETFKPSLVIVDTLRAFQPAAEKNDEIAKFLQDGRKVARSVNCAVLLLHHVRKPGEDGAPPLEDTPILEWLTEASGARALINQTNTRIAFDTARRVGANDAAFVMKSFVKVKGESGPFYLERVCNDEGDPIGYRSMAGVHLLGNLIQEAAFNQLPRQFAFKDAKRIYGRSDDPTRKWLIKCQAANLLRQIGRGTYELVG